MQKAVKSLKVQSRIHENILQLNNNKDNGDRNNDNGCIPNKVLMHCNNINKKIKTVVLKILTNL